MRLKYDITVDDLLAFNLNHHQKSPVLRRTRFWCVIGLSLMIVWLTFVASEIVGQREVLWAGIATAVIMAGIYPLLWRRNISQITKRLFAEGKNRGTIGPHVVELLENGLFHGCETYEGTVFWKGIERIETIPGHTFVYISAVGAHVIPECAVTEGSYDSFIDELRSRWRQVCPE